MPRQFRNQSGAGTTLSAAAAAGATSLSVTDGAIFSATTNGPFSIRIEDAGTPTTYEIVNVTARATNTLTVDPTTLAWSAGAKVFQVVAAVDLDGFAENADLSAYQALSDLAFVRKTADESVVSSTTLQNDDHLFFPIGANEIWSFNAVLFYETAEGGDLKVAFAVPTGAAGGWGAAGGLVATATGGTGSTDPLKSGLGGSKTYGGAGSGAQLVLTLMGVVVNGATAGSLQLQFAQGTSSTTASILLAHSHIAAKKVA